MPYVIGLHSLYDLEHLREQLVDTERFGDDIVLQQKVMSQDHAKKGGREMCKSSEGLMRTIPASRDTLIYFLLALPV
jgi:hypothetical protein